MAATEFIGAVDNDWNDAGNWDNGVPTAADDGDVPAAKTCEIDCAAVCLTLTIGGLVSHKAGGSYSLTNDGLITIQNGGELRKGNGGTPIAAGQTAELIFNPASDNVEMLQIDHGGKLTGCGTATATLASESWADCYDTLAAQAASGQKNIQVATAAKIGNLSNGDEILVQGTSSYNQDEIRTVDSVAGDTITCTANLTHAHAAGAYISILTRNVIIRSADPAKRGWIDDDNTSAASANVDLKLVEMRDLYYGFNAPAGRVDLDYVAMNACYRPLSSPVGPIHASNIIIADTAYYMLNGGTKVFVTNGIFGKCSTYAVNLCRDLRMSGAIIHGTEGIRGNIDKAVNCEVLHNRRALAYPDGDIDLIGCNFHDNTVGYYLATQRFTVNMRNTIFTAGTLWSGTGAGCRARIHEQDTAQTLGASKTTIVGIGTIERQNAVARSGYAAECTPDTQCSSDEPLEIEWDVACEHGDVLSVEVYVRVNAAYGTANDPQFILDPDSIYGCNDESTEDVALADTWTKLTVTGTANLGGAGVKGTVNCVLHIPHYTAGGKVYVDDFKVTKS